MSNARNEGTILKESRWKRSNASYSNWYPFLSISQQDNLLTHDPDGSDVTTVFVVALHPRVPHYRQFPYYGGKPTCPPVRLLNPGYLPPSCV